MTIAHTFQAQADDDAVCTCGKAKAHHQAFLPPCDLCGSVQTENGAVLYGPPGADRLCLKFHVCITCFHKVVDR